MTNTVEMIVAAENIVGESAVWDARRQSLYWVDIIGRRVLALRADGSVDGWDMPGIVTSIGLCADGRAIMGQRKSVALWDFVGDPALLAEVEPNAPATRLNEGVVGPDGAYWVGTMQDNIGLDDAPQDITATLGRLWRVTPDGAVHALCTDRFGITNTLVWTDDDRLITADTMENTLYSYAISEGTLSDRRILLAGFARGLPDGSCRDADGYVWNCRVVGGGCVIRIAPDGSIDRVIDLPCSWPTSCAFGGPELDHLYITSARFTMTAEHLAANPQEGSLFRVNPGCTGLAPHRFGG